MRAGELAVGFQGVKAFAQRKLRQAGGADVGLHLGRIGQLFAQRLAAFETQIVAYDPYVSAARATQLGIELLPLY